MDENDNPWTTLSVREVYDNPWISVHEHAVLNPAGLPGIYGVVGMKRKALGVIPIDRAGHTVLVGQFRYSLKRFSWEIVEGGMEPGETPEDGIARELAEEAGLVAGQWMKLADLDTSNCVTDETAILYAAWGLTSVPPRPEPCEKLHLRRVPFREALAMAMDGRITDALSVAGLLKLDALCRQGGAPSSLARLIVP